MLVHLQSPAVHWLSRHTSFHCAHLLAHTCAAGAGSRLVDLCVAPAALVDPQSQLRLNGVYYISKQILPALERVLSLLGVNARAW